MSFFNNNLINLVVFAPEIYIAFFAIAILMVAVFIIKKDSVDSERANIFKQLNRFSIFAMVLAAIFLFITMNINSKDQISGISSYLFSYDMSSNLFRLLILSAGILVLSISRNYIETKKIYEYEYLTIQSFAILGSMLMVSANHFITLYVAIEMQAISFYILIASERDSRLSNEASIKYFVLSAFASALLLFGVSYVYGFTGAMNFDNIANVIATQRDTLNIGAILLGAIFIMCGILFKLSAAPFYMWAPDVYEGSPTNITAMLATVSKIAGVFVAMKLLWVAFISLAFAMQYVIVAAGILSFIVGFVGAINQRSLRKIFAFSSIGNIGFILMALAVFQPDLSYSIFTYLLFYVIASMIFFLTLMSIKVNGEHIRTIDDLSGLNEVAPFISFAMSAGLLSIAGIPPLAGFFGKLYILGYMISNGYVVYAAIAIMMSAVGLFYYLRIVKNIYFDPHSGKQTEVRLSIPASYILMALVTLTIAMPIIYSIFA